MARRRELVFTPSGAVELRAIAGTDKTGKPFWRTDWSSDGDDDAAEELGRDQFDEDDTDDILDYLEGAEILEDGEEVDLVEEYTDADDDEEDEADDNG